MERTVAALTRHYPHRDQAFAQALAVLAAYPGLLNPEQSDFTYDDGRVELLLSLTGVLPVPIGPNIYHCPIAIWLPLNFPAKPPTVFVLPSETLAIRKGKNIDASGKVGMPYLDNWARKAEGCSLTGLIQDLIPVFSARYPVSVVQPKTRPSRPAASLEAAQSQSSSPLQNQPPQPPPPRPPPPVASPSPVNGRPPRPPLPSGTAQNGSRPSSGVFELGDSAGFGPAGSRLSGSPAPPPRPPPPATGGPPASRPLPGSFTQPLGPPPAYPAQPPRPPPAQPPVLPPQRASTIMSYDSPPPVPPGIPAQPPNQSAPHPQDAFSPPPHSQGHPAPVGPAAPPSYHQPPSQPPVPAPNPHAQPPAAHSHTPPRPASPAASNIQAYSPTPSSVAPPQPPHPPRQRDPRYADEQRRASIDSTRPYQPTPPQPPRSRHAQPHQPSRPYSPAPSDIASYASYGQPPQPPAEHRPQKQVQHTSQPSLDSQRGPPGSVSPPQPPPPQQVHHHLERAGRERTASPAPPSPAPPPSEAGSSSTVPFRSRGPRPPPPPSEYSATGEYGSYMPSSQQTSMRGVPTMTDDDLYSQASGYTSRPEEIHRALGRAPQPAPVPPQTRTSTNYYQRAPESMAYAEFAGSSPFEPIIESRVASGATVPYQPRQPPRQSSFDSHHDIHPPSAASYSSYGAPQPPYLPPTSSAISSPPPPQPRAAPVAPTRANGHLPPPAPYAAVPSPPAPVVSAAQTARKARPTKATPLNILDAADDDLASPSSASPSSVASPTSVSVLGTPAAPPPVPPNPALLALRTRVHSKLVSSLTTLAHATEAELSQLDLMRVDLEKAQPAIEDEMARLEAVKSVCLGVRDRYAEFVDQAEGRLREYEARGEGVEVDEIVCGSTVVYTQLLDLVAEDAALEDTIYALGRGLNSGTANIDLDRFLKRVRLLAKEQFVIRATINKILLGLAIRRERSAQASAGANGDASGRGTAVASGEGD
ncbi:ESCRT-I complex subunit TSG101 [Rhodotorula toruloides]|uniref:ESCRT-I complex subunit TSG101 n=1 Tax=Rhodotorula toruloides TaxID=5286 RepID=A0A511KGM3_RHOTO|nr:ESCRT-I complex subunit TSG101 [Rhodotorula toruloides]